jgi:type IV pilus assembly protein PilY1
MKAKQLCTFFLIHTLLFTVLLFFGAGSSSADDTDVYQASVKNNAMLVIDVSGSMAWPVYDPNIDYAAFFEWAIGAGYGHDDTDLNDWDAVKLAGTLWQKDKIYLVSAYTGYAEITGEDGVTKYAATGDPVYTGSTRRERWVTGGIIDTGWEVTDWDNPVENNTIETVTVGTDVYVVYPTNYDETKADNGQDIGGNYTVAYANANIAGQRFKNHQDIMLTDERVDPRTSVAKDYGFLGYLKAPGIYFSGLFETGTWYTLTDNPNSAVSSSGDERIYAFVTGNYLSFIKLIEDLDGDGTCGSEGWRDICYQPGARIWHTVSIGTIRNAEYYTKTDYSRPRNEDCGVIDLTQFAGRKYLKIYFQNYYSRPGLDIENRTVGSCTCTGSGSENDGVYFVDQDGNVLRQLTAGVNETPEGKIYGCDQLRVWTGEYDVTNVTKIYVKFYVAPNGAHNCAGSDQGFRISQIKWTSQESATGPSAAGTFACCNGDDGVGYKIRSRLEVAQDAMKIVVDETREKINWGLVKWSGYSISQVTALTEGADAVIAGIDTLTANGGTPMGNAMQKSYNWMYDYLSTHTATAACSENYQVVMTDGFPSGDTTWNSIYKNSDPDPVFTNSDYIDADTWTGDPIQTSDPNHSDDVARWMARGKCAESQDTTGNDPDYNVVTHTIGFGLESPLLNDTAEDGCGIGITAYDQTELVNAFYSLGLAMVSAVSFTAPVVSVDEANRTQSGDNLYMAFFKPKEGQHWQGNLKKYGLSYEIRTDCGRSDPEWTVVDKNGIIAGDCDGSFKSASTSHWSSANDGGEVNSGGAGGKLKEALDAVSLATGPYYDFRKIYTYTNGSMVRFTPSNITNVDLAVTQDSDRYKIINYIYGYTYNADSTGYPVATRSWILGDIIHSEPRIIDYLDTDGSLLYRFIAVASNDGMLHVFTDFECTLSAETYPAGSEVFAFVPADLLPRLQEFASTDHVYMVDGACNYFRAQTQTGGYYDKTLVFGERRGGRSYWALDVTNPDPINWTVKWHIEGGTGEFTELGFTWNKPYFAKIKTAASTYKDVVIFAGGYDTLEDGFPEEFDDDEQNPNGIRETGETYVETANIGTYDKYNPGIDDIGRGIFVVDINDASILFRATYSASDDTLGIYQSYANMTFCFPADMTVIPLSTTNLIMYAADIYGQIWKITYDYFADALDYLDANSVKWQVKRVFKSNPGSDLATGDPDIAGASLNSADTGRKTFYSPDVSYFGNCWTSKPVLYFGTGDRAHPRYAMISNRFYTVADHNTLTDETDLLNLTCDELDENADSDGNGTVDSDDSTRKQDLISKLSNESVSRGFYRVIDKQGNCPQCSISHVGEKILSRPTLFFKNVYFTAYQPVFDDPCNPNGNAFIYAIDYCWGKSVFNYSEETGPEERNIEDTYQIIQNSSIPSGVRVITRGGHAAGLISAGGAVSGVGEDLTTNIPGPPGGVSQILWETD